MCLVWSYWPKNNVSIILSAVWSYFGEVKHCAWESNRWSVEQTVVGNSQSLKQAIQSITNVTWPHWRVWRRKSWKTARYEEEKNCSSTTTLHHITGQWKVWQKPTNYSSNASALTVFTPRIFPFVRRPQKNVWKALAWLTALKGQLCWLTKLNFFPFRNDDRLFYYFNEILRYSSYHCTSSVIYSARQFHVESSVFTSIYSFNCCSHDDATTTTFDGPLVFNYDLKSVTISRSYSLFKMKVQAVEYYIKYDNCNRL